MQIELIELLTVSDHILPQEGQHWVSPTYIARHVSGEPAILEPGKCTAIGWFSLEALPEPLSQISQDDMVAYRQKYSNTFPPSFS